MTPIDTARFWLSQGVASVPLHFMSKVPAVKWTEFKSRLPNENLINLWYQEPRNIALVTGWQRLLALEFDVPEKFSAWYVWHLIHNPAILNTYRVLSNRGIHYYFYLKEDVKLVSIQHSLFEIKSGGKLITIPPSVHSSGKLYHSLDDPSNIRVVSIEEILNYSSITLTPRPFLPTRSKYAPANIPTNNPIEAIKAGVSILSFFPVAQKIDDRFYRCDCPFHGHKNNFWIDTQLNICGCFAGCIGWPSLDVIDFYARLNEFDIKQAVKELLTFT
jgi:hypothetical protein